MQWQFALLIVGLCLCGKIVAQEPDFDALQAELNQNRALWEASKGERYVMTITRQCFCVVEALGPFVVTVVNDVIVSVEPQNQFSNDLPTVDEVLDQIQRAIDDRVAQLTVTYDATFGYPTNVFIDQDFLLADEEIGYEISVTLDNDNPAPTCSTELVTQRLPVIEPSIKAFRNGFNVGEYMLNLQRWRTYLQTVNCVYRYKLTRSCFCGTDFVGPFIISVENGVVIDAEFEGEPDSEIPVPTDLPTITDLFGIILDEAQEADRVEISYDSTTGVPISAFFDRFEGTVDDEITYLAELL